MKPVPVYDVFGMMDGRDDLDMNRRGIPEWRLNDVLRYFTSRGYDRILVECRTQTLFEPPVFSVVRHQTSAA